ncbi:hypothetical protein [Parasitella parasitica]|uniref:rRNA-processing protein EFG1 n=1 Tax=Parasitella parasitica TaxID=35722 RepID=A0A0B7MZN4_9FUNG|nr:hypothetical protein [Parasitella parasitica]
MKVLRKDNSNSKPAKSQGPKDSIPISAGKIKKKIRDTQRTLSKKDLPANVLTEAKRRLRVLEFDLGEKIIDDHERENSTKYHKVKHFERKKVERKLKQSVKALEKAKTTVEEENAEIAAKITQLEEKVDEWQVKLSYVRNYPKTLPYISLFPQENENDTKSLARKTRLLQEIRQALIDGDEDLTILKKRYRDSYKEKLIQRKLIQPVAPVDIEAMETENKRQEADGDSSGSDNDDIQDDFFEKAN